jgi:GntR family transcriptional regulator, histidine utilization repressor
MAAQTFRAIKDELMRRVRARLWLPGQTIPGEIALAAEFGVARATVNRALRELTDEGVLQRRRNAGTRVAVNRIRQARLDIPLIRVEIEASGAAYRHALLEQETIAAPDWLAARLSLASSDRIIHLRCLHFADGTPHVLEERWINLSAVPEAAAADFSLMNPNEWLVGAVPFTTAEFTFSAETLDSASAMLLSAKPGQASFTAERVTWLAGQAVTLARLSFRPGHRMVTRI